MSIMENNRTIELNELKDYIANFKAVVIETAELFQGYEVNKATAILVEITEGIQWLMNILVAANIMNEDDIKQINVYLNEIVEGLMNQDYILVGDLLQYEIIPKVEQMEQKFTVLQN